MPASVGCESRGRKPGTGLRISEACGLRVGEVEFLRKVIPVRQQRRPGGDLGRLKTGSSQRDISAVDAVHVEKHGLQVQGVGIRRIGADQIRVDTA
jgi:hypothetical protein